jgi:hypothetical protein
MPRLRPLLAAPLALAAGGLTATALAVPPGGPVENPLGASVTLATPAVAYDGTVTVSGSGYDPAEHVSLKVDDGAARDASRNDVLQTVDAAGDGTFTTTVDLSRIVPALGNGRHDVRLLSAAAAGARSIHVDFTATGAPATAPAPSSAPTGSTPTATTPTTTTGTPVSATAPSIASTALRATRAGTVALRLRGGSAGLKATVSVRTRSGRGVALTRALEVSVRADATKTYKLKLTAAGRRQVRRHARLAVVVKVTPTDGAKAFKTSLTLKRAASPEAA